MKKFDIHLSPDLPNRKSTVPISEMRRIHMTDVDKLESRRYILEYEVCGRKFAYYPASILTILNDILLELDIIERKESHYMTLSGYIILQMNINGNMASFRTAEKHAATAEECFVCENISLHSIKSELERVANAIWAEIERD